MDICEPYEPDLQDELIGDAMAVGGRRFVEEATFEATALAEQTCPWDGRGDEPAAYRSAWLAHLGQLVAARRAALLRSSATPHPDPSDVSPRPSSNSTHPLTSTRPSRNDHWPQQRPGKNS